MAGNCIQGGNSAYDKHAQQAGYGSAAREPRVLLVDDDRELCQMLGEYLSAEHFEVKSVHDGSDALALLEVSDFEILILDVMLPSVSAASMCCASSAPPTAPRFSC
jgi:CheY-like chemotaxis protein